jgi:hypothetical protein
MDETPKHWILNPMSKLFEVIPKKLKPLQNLKSLKNENFLKNKTPLEENKKNEETFVLNQLAWIPRNIKMTPRLIRRLSNDLKNKYRIKNKYNKK